MISGNTCEVFMKDVMQEECLQECEIKQFFQIKNIQNPKNEGKKSKKT